MATANVIIEEWKDIPDTNSFYRVSNLGNIASTDRYKQTRKGLRFYRGKQLKLQTNIHGYYCHSLGRNADVSVLAHRMVASAFIPNPENKPFVNHKDGNKKNNCIENLEWVTRQENEDHAYATGLKKNLSGENHFNVKLTEIDIRQIRAMFDPIKMTYDMIAEKYNIHRGTVTRIINRSRWKCVQ